MAINFDFGNLNNIAKDGWDYISNVAKNLVSKENFEKLKISDAEAAAVYKDKMIAKNTLTNNLNMNDINNIFSASANKDNAEYISAFNSFQQSANLGKEADLKQAAAKLDEFDRQGKYLDALQAAEGKRMENAKMYNLGNDQLNYLAREEIKDKLNKNKITNRLLGENINTKIAGVAHKASAAVPTRYFMTDDVAVNQTRAIAAGVGYAGTALATRYLQGGTVTQNEYGKRDIAGIPFI